MNVSLTSLAKCLLAPYVACNYNYVIIVMGTSSFLYFGQVQIVKNEEPCSNLGWDSHFGTSNSGDSAALKMKEKFCISKHRKHGAFPVISFRFKCSECLHNTFVYVKSVIFRAQAQDKIWDFPGMLCRKHVAYLGKHFPHAFAIQAWHLDESFICCSEHIALWFFKVVIKF